MLDSLDRIERTIRRIDRWMPRQGPRLGQMTLGEWLRAVTPAYRWGWPYLVYLRSELERVVSGETKRLMVMMPPRHGKTATVTVRFPVWWMERRPGLRVIVAAYNQTLANKFSRMSRKLAQMRLGLREDRRAVEEWETQTGCWYRAVGVGGGITGMGGDLIIIDDPTKSREEAQSTTYREKVWEWYTNDLYTRLEPGGAAILVMCMTGDTPVLMADGTERPLREIKVGDQVATYDNGKLATSIVRNHKSNGVDYVFAIKMISGKVVYANERHPFLVEEHGQLKWIRLKNLTMAHRIVTVKDRRVSGRERHASLMVAENLLARGVTVLSTTEKRCGLTDIARRQLMQNTGAIYASNSDTELLPPSMMRCLRRKVANALFADNHRAITSALIGPESCALIMTTTPTLSGDSSVTIATSLWGIPRQRQPRSPLSNTSDFTTEAIASIEPAGVKEVFDIQVERTENFIANGLVSHNTRWHEDDLAGRILSSEEGKNWRVVRLPALAEDGDLLGRAPGEVLNSERYPVEELLKIKAVLGSWAFEALYQQRPMPAEGGMFRREWFNKFLDAVPAQVEARVRYWDKAATAGDGDYTVGVRMSRVDGVYYVEDVTRGRWSPGERDKVICQCAETDPLGTHIWLEQEPGSSGVDSVQALIRMLSGYSVHADRVTGSKQVRAEPFAAQAEAGNVVLVRGYWNAAFLDELLVFPNGQHDDQVDAASGAFGKLAIPLLVEYGENLWR